MEIQNRLAEKKNVNYKSEAYNKHNSDQQWIRLTDGCPWNCPYCYCPKDVKTFSVPEIVRRSVKIMDMNILANPDWEKIFDSLEKQNLGKIHYDFICGFDFRFVNDHVAQRIKKLGVKKIRLAWDWFMGDQKKLRHAINCFKRVKYDPRKIMIFMLCNWKISFKECCRKLDLLKIWNVEVADCYYDNQTMPNVIPIFWSDKQIKEFRSKCRKHNQMIYHGIDPEI